MVEDQSVHNKVHTFHGDLIKGMPTLVHFLPDKYFNLATQVQVPTLMSAKTLLAADAAITSFGSFVAGNPGTTPARTPKACVLPAKYVGYLLSHEDGVEPRQFLEELLPVIEANGNAIALEPFTTFVISAMTKTVGQSGQGPGPSAVFVAVSTSVARNTALITHSQRRAFCTLTSLV
jgi:hypothetical protein